MTDIQFARLKDLPLREAWPHEAHQFTPWLAENIDHLSDAIEIPLELTGTEVAVETFSADILARNPMDDSVVLIENQLEQTDHTHLGQIMTYLAGLEAQTVVWIAPSFREPHLSAIRWLNEHTADGFSFFAVKARVVRIGNSPYAPIFEVVEKPDDWARSVQRRTQPGRSALSQKRADFWHGLLQAHPELVDYGLKPGAVANITLPTPLPNVVLGLYVAARTCGIYFRRSSNKAAAEVDALLQPGLAGLSGRLGVDFNSEAEPDWYLTDTIAHPINDQDNWPTIWNWMAERIKAYSAAITDYAAGHSE